MSDAKLKRCPFCGGEGNVHLSSDNPPTIFGMNCRDCGCVGPWEDTEEEAIAAWSRRAAPGPGWVRVEDGLPERGYYVIVIDNDFDEDLIADVDLWDGVGWHSNNIRKAAFAAGISASPEPQTQWTHWMPFPAPPPGGPDDE